jgi:hypothetical protein
MDFLKELVSLVIGIYDYNDAFLAKQWRGRAWFFRFYGRVFVACCAIVLFVYQQLAGNNAPFSEVVAYSILIVGLVQAAAPLFYLLVLRFPFWFFVTERYKHDLNNRRWPEPLKSGIVVGIEICLVVLSILGFFERWYIVFLVFLWSIPVAIFYVLLPLFALVVTRSRIVMHLDRFDDRLERPQQQRPR